MASLLDASLEDIIKSKAATRVAGKGGKGKKTGGPVKNTPAKNKSRAAAVPYKSPTTKFDGACNNCGKTGHKASDCRGAKKAGGAPVSVRGGGNNNTGVLNRLGGKSSASPTGTMVSVGNLAADIISKDVSELFGTVGEVLSAKVIFKNGRSTGKAQVVFAQQSKANEAVKQFHSRTLDGVAMEVKVVPRNEQMALQQGAAGNTKASLFGSALGGAGRGAGRGQDPSFSIVLPAGATRGNNKTAKFDGTCNNCSKAGHKASECRSAPKKAAAAPKAPKAKAAPKPKAPKPEPADAGNLDDDLDSYFKANKPNGEAVEAVEAAPVE